MNPTVFVSYSHSDMIPTHWLERLRIYLAPFRRAGGVELWDDSKIQPGSDWRSSISAAIDQAAAAILLIGPGFLASEFIADDELPAMLRQAREKGLAIFPLIVAYCGYRQSSLGSLQAFNDPETPLEALLPAQQNKILNDLSLAADQRVRGPGTGRTVENTTEDLGNVLIELDRQLSITRKAFAAQSQRRNDLVSRMTSRLSVPGSMQYEKFFFRYFHEMDREERFEFDQIRALTEGPLRKGNLATLDLLSRYPALLNRFPKLADLQQHLVFWMNKYDKVFSRTPEMAVLYTGVEDAVPFPEGLDASVQTWIRQEHPPNPTT